MSTLRTRRGQSTLENIIGLMIVGTGCYMLLSSMAGGDDSTLGQIWSFVRGSLDTILDFAIEAFTS